MVTNWDLTKTKGEGSPSGVEDYVGYGANGRGGPTVSLPKFLLRAGRTTEYESCNPPDLPF